MQFGRLRRAAGLARQVRKVSGYRPAGEGVDPRGGQGLALAAGLVAFVTLRQRPAAADW